MDIDIKKIIEQVTSKIKGDDKLMATFKKDPVKAIESVIGVDLPDEKLSGVVTAVKAKLAGSDGKDLLGSLGDMLGKK